MNSHLHRTLPPRRHHMLSRDPFRPFNSIMTRTMLVTVQHINSGIALAARYRLHLAPYPACLILLRHAISHQKIPASRSCQDTRMLEPRFFDIATVREFFKVLPYLRSQPHSHTTKYPIKRDTQTRRISPRSLFWSTKEVPSLHSLSKA